MLFYFSASNFRSIRNELTLSMSAGRFKSAVKNRGFPTGFAQMPCALRATAIYGANGSGKSSLVKAIDFFQDFVTDSFANENAELIERAVAYRYTIEGKPTTFEACFVAESVMYTYGFSIENGVVAEEWLHVKSQEGRVREAFSRFRAEDSYEWSFSPFFKSKRSINTWRDSTRPNALFLSTAIFLNCEELRPVFNWISHTLRVVAASSSLGTLVTSGILLDTDQKEEIVQLLRFADPTIDHVFVEKKSIDDNSFGFLTEEARGRILEHIKDIPSYDVKLSHRNVEGADMSLDLAEESDGTQAMYKYAAPFVQSVANDFVLVIDELDRSLHPLLLQALVEKIANPDDQKTRAQLIFTTHDSALLSSDVLARDQVWFADNPHGRGTELIPLADYKPRKGEAIQRAYLHGRYGGVPIARQRVLDLGSAE